MTGSGPLSGLRVLELGHFVAAPFAARLLADFGAEVIKVEQPGQGDPMRALGRKSRGRGLWWSSLVRNKRLVTADLHSPEGREVVLKLAAKCDVVVENFRAGQLERWGIGPVDLRRGNPQLIIARISGFGQTGPYRNRVSLASIGECLGGLLALMGDPEHPDAPPIRASLSLGDTISALFAAMGILAALHNRAFRSAGETIDVAMFESVFSLLESTITEFGSLELVRRRSGSSNPNFAPSGFYLTADDQWLCITATGEALFARLATVIGLPELTADERYRTNEARVSNRSSLDLLIARWVRGRDAQGCEEMLHGAQIPASRVYSIRDCASDPHYQARNAIVTVDDPVAGQLLHPGIFPRFEQAVPAPIRIPGPIGCDNEAVYSDLLGMSRQEIAELAEKRVI